MADKVLDVYVKRDLLVYDLRDRTAEELKLIHADLDNGLSNVTWSIFWGGKPPILYKKLLDKYYPFVVVPFGTILYRCRNREQVSPFLFFNVQITDMSVFAQFLAQLVPESKNLYVDAFVVTHPDGVSLYMKRAGQDFVELESLVRMLTFDNVDPGHLEARIDGTPVSDNIPLARAVMSSPLDGWFEEFTVPGIMSEILVRTELTQRLKTWIVPKDDLNPDVDLRMYFRTLRTIETDAQKEAERLGISGTLL